MTLRLKQLQNKFWIEDNIVSVFPFDNNFYKKLFYSKRNYDNWILENIKILKNNNIDISINNKLSIEKYKITGGNNIPPKKWYKELQNIITIDGKTLKPEYKTSAVSHFKGYNMAQCEIDRNNILKQLTFIGVWNNRSNDIEIGCELDNIEQLNQKTFNCNILVNTNDCLIVRVQSNNAINDVHYRLILNNNNLKAILQTNLLDITDLSYNNFLFKNNWKSYETTINHSVLSIDRLVKINDNLITKLYPGSYRNQLLIIQKQLLESSTRKFEIYTDGSVRDFRSQQCTISFGFIIVRNNMILHSFRSKISYFSSSNKAEFEVTIYTDSNNVITGYYDIIDRNNFIISPRKFFKIRTNNIYWSILREIIVTNNLTLDFIKVKRHSDNYFNNYIDEFITHTDETLNLVFKANNLNNLDYVSH
ncbi:hypothetical protein GLOIN_2v1770500 [Rhizophagus irregularis DAOM 181602=DAOM 197198]|uniref:Uncharacterized protein n=1 Tax=Rhizophagus irregularis (strain DAOM 181602 / DAOM 197198 / MUCL 43194) TaxID=747089 RepID=A0A2P4QBV7_RHIID|nr:hypothetical protein GLOIN_2v1770500 [Rhizophagus irregularis DAOM 181602=DAOM 197198]POG75120.1 hypothetical protein GLOIN_2v1770500 [Rhizophagus irregularis DAOM 181602=DAOM 197198]|eukprot:XP_025181986.1 hypothetical protein GLOIN_2v1770500 [Rhizophagus irregularis DAOM 181602=DAOM 197198]